VKCLLVSLSRIAIDEVGIFSDDRKLEQDEFCQSILNYKAWQTLNSNSHFKINEIQNHFRCLWACDD
jgi:hypothetical protein